MVGEKIDLSKEASNSHQGRGKAYFDHRIEQSLQRVPQGKELTHLFQMITAVLDWLALTYIEILNEINLAQVFLWF